MTFILLVLVWHLSAHFFCSIGPYKASCRWFYYLFIISLLDREGWAASVMDSWEQGTLAQRISHCQLQTHCLSSCSQWNAHQSSHSTTGDFQLVQENRRPNPVNILFPAMVDPTFTQSLGPKHTQTPHFRLSTQRHCSKSVSRSHSLNKYLINKKIPLDEPTGLFHISITGILCADCVAPGIQGKMRKVQQLPFPTALLSLALVTCHQQSYKNITFLFSERKSTFRLILL